QAKTIKPRQLPTPTAIKNRSRSKSRYALGRALTRSFLRAHLRDPAASISLEHRNIVVGALIVLFI
ncbi:MAG: hypothetical protein J2P55_04895, partial [Rhizobiales bacterium]|nr:hypothetical protein [Hyphomicrobiales bacterium]